MLKTLNVKVLYQYRHVRNKSHTHIIHRVVDQSDNNASKEILGSLWEALQLLYVGANNNKSGNIFTAPQ